jgi:hypothetical protein
VPAPDGPQFNKPNDWHWTVTPESPEAFEAESHDEYRVRTFFKGEHQPGGDYFATDWDEALENMQTNLTAPPEPDYSDVYIDEHHDYENYLSDIGEDRETDPTRGFTQSDAQRDLQVRRNMRQGGASPKDYASEDTWEGQ